MEWVESTYHTVHCSKRATKAVMMATEVHETEAATGVEAAEIVVDEVETTEVTVDHVEVEMMMTVETLVRTAQNVPVGTMKVVETEVHGVRLADTMAETVDQVRRDDDRVFAKTFERN
jgi:hypothetical protein